MGAQCGREGCARWRRPGFPPAPAASGTASAGPSGWTPPPPRGGRRPACRGGEPGQSALAGPSPPACCLASPGPWTRSWPEKTARGSRRRGGAAAAPDSARVPAPPVRPRTSARPRDLDARERLHPHFLLQDSCFYFPGRQGSWHSRGPSHGRADGRRAARWPLARAARAHAPPTRSGMATRGVGRGLHGPDVTTAPSPPRSSSPRRGIYLRKEVAAAGTGVVERPGGAGSPGAHRQTDPSRRDAQASVLSSYTPHMDPHVFAPCQILPNRISPPSFLFQRKRYF